MRMLKGFIMMPIIGSLGSAAMQSVGSLGSGIGRATQSMIGAGVAITSMKLFKIK